MTIFEVIKKRRSTRNFDPTKKITDAQVKTLIEAGHFAPSSGNLQDTYFIIIKDQKTKLKLLDKGACYQKFILDAPIIIVVCGRPEIVTKKYGDRGLRYSIQNAAAATQNILLTAHSLGLSSCWIGSFNDQKVRQVLDLDDSFLPLSILPIGFSTKSPSPPERKPLHKISKFI